VHLITSVKIQSAANRVDNPLNPDSLYYLLSQTDTSAGRGFAAMRNHSLLLLHRCNTVKSDRRLRTCFCQI